MNADRLIRWYRQRRFITAYRILRNEYERHRDAGHEVHFRAINEAYIFLDCEDCPWYPEPSMKYEDDDG